MRSSLLAKPAGQQGGNQTLRKHSEAVKRAALTLAENYEMPRTVKENQDLDQEAVRDYLSFSALFHDLGKSDRRFQDRMRGESDEPRSNHPLLSLLFAEKGLQHLHSVESLDQLATLAIVTHHTPLWENLYQNQRGQQLKLADRAILELDEILADWGYELEIPKLVGQKPYKVFYKAYKGIMSKVESDPLLYRSLFSYISGILTRADHLVSSGEWFSKTVHPYEFFDKNSYTDYQKDAAKVEGNLFITLPTGLGKTETALNWFKHQQVDRLFYILPTRSTINSMYLRLSELYANEVGVLHSSAETFLYSEENETDFYEHQNFQRNIVVTTPDQIILTLMNKGHFGEMEILFSNSAFVFDEIHTYSPKTFYLIKYMLENLHEEFGTPQCIMSATFPDFLKDQFSFLDPEELLEEDNLVNIYRGLDRVQPVYRDIKLTEDSNGVVEDYRADKSVLVVTNTVDRSKKVYRSLRNHPEVEKEDISLLHSRFIRKDRKAKEEKVKEFEDQEGKIFVSTQIVEVSLDISYDVLHTEICPIDSLSQRLGRVNRRIDFSTLQNDSQATAYVYEPENELPYENLNKSREVVQWLTENYESEYDLLKANNKFYELIKENILANDKNEYRRIWKQLDYIRSPNLSEERYRQLLKTRSGLVSVSGVPKKFIKEIEALDLEKKRCDGFKERQLVDIKQQQFLTKIPVYMSDGNILTEQSEKLGVNIFDLNYNSETGIES